jgi:hypothetical protein
VGALVDDTVSLNKATRQAEGLVKHQQVQLQDTKEALLRCVMCVLGCSDVDRSDVRCLEQYPLPAMRPAVLRCSYTVHACSICAPLSAHVLCLPVSLQVCQGVQSAAQDPIPCQHHPVEWHITAAWESGSDSSCYWQRLLTTEQPSQGPCWVSFRSWVTWLHVEVCCTAARPVLNQTRHLAASCADNVCKRRHAVTRAHAALQTITTQLRLA